MSSSNLYDSKVRVASEAIVIIDIVQATATSNLFGWYAVGRRLVHELRQLVLKIGEKYGLTCIKSTGDGFLLTYSNSTAAELSALNAVKASLELLENLAKRNQEVAEERKLDIRFAIHFGEVDVLEQDREGPNISYTFRLESINTKSLIEAINPIDPDDFPLRNYVLCSEHVSNICTRHEATWTLKSCGLFKLKGFSGRWEVFLVEATGDK
ncbi:MAG: adenylate/guanylate cyclase domain-containing protein [Pseudomonadota bacterium]